MVRMMEGVTVADPEPIVNRQHDIAVVGEILIHRIAVAVIVHVVPAEQHLPRRASVDEDHARLFRAASVVEQLAVNRPAIRGFERDRARNDQLGLGEFRRNHARLEVAAVGPVQSDRGNGRRRLGARADERDLRRARRDRRPF